jgi:hypothetical protein
MSTNERGHKRPRHKYKYKHPSRDYAALFTRTIESYLECRFLIDTGNIPASDPDPCASRPVSLTYRAEHVAEIEKAVRAVLTTKLHQDCFDVILKEIAGTASVDPAFSLGVRVDVVQAVGRELERKRLAPWLYFSRSQKK